MGTGVSASLFGQNDILCHPDVYSWRVFGLILFKKYKVINL